MTATAGHSGLRHGWLSLVGSALVAAAASASLLALSGLLLPGRWLRAGAVAVFVLAIVTAAARSVARSRWAPTVAGAITGVVGLLIAYGGPPGRMQVVPDAGSVERLVTAVRAATTLINASVVPMAPARPVELLVVAGAIVVFLVVDFLALGFGVPAWSGLVLVAMWLPAVGLGFPAPGNALAWTAIPYLLLLSLSVAPRAEIGTRRVATTLGIAGALVVAALVAGPLVAAAPGWAWLTLPSFGNGPIGPLHLSDNLDLRQSLGRRSGQVVLHYTVRGLSEPRPKATHASPSATNQPGTATARVIGPLRAFTLKDFDGRGWQRTETAQLQEWRANTLLASEPQVQGTNLDPGAGTVARVDVTIDDLRELRLPVSTFPRTVEIAGPWRYDAERDEVIGDQVTGPGTTYSMTVEVPHLTADQLHAARGRLPASTEAYLAVPRTQHADEIRALATQVASDAQDPYTQALALQTYFRDSSRFAYDTRVAPGLTDDAVWDFLQNRHGYCVQFATSMAIMARTLGIPARLGVGFLPGDAGSDGIYTVTGRLSHTWPELYLAGAGWVRFEPTPAVQTGSPPLWSDPLSAVSAAPIAGDVPKVASGPVTPLRSAGPGAATGSISTGTDASGQRLLAGAGLVLVLVVGATLVARRRSRRDDRTDPQVAWRRLRDRLRPAGITWSDARTSRQCIDLVRERVVELRGTPLGGPADSALVRLAEAFELHLYAPAPTDVPAVDLEGWVAAVLADVTAKVSDRPRPGASATAPRAGS